MKTKKNYSCFLRSRPEQLYLLSLPNIFPSKRGDYSAIINLYDFIPKYYYGDLGKIRKNGKYLDILTKWFKYKKQDMILNIYPAIIKNSDGSEKAFYPSQREELVEDALRKLATDSNNNDFLDDRLSVKFTLYSLWKELRKTKHPYDYNEIVESLNILSSVGLEIKTSDNKITFKSNMFETFGIINNNPNIVKDIDSLDEHERNKYAKKIIYFVRFNSLVSNGIKYGTWRVLNYKQCMLYKKAVSRWLYKRISYTCPINLKTKPTYNIMLTTIIRDSGMTEYGSLRLNLAQVQKCLNDMVTLGSIDKYEIRKIYDNKKRNKIKDAKFLIFISDSFYEDLKLNSFIKKSSKLINRKEQNNVLKNTEEINYNNKDNNVCTVETSPKKEQIKSLLEELLKEYKLSSEHIDKIVEHINKINNNNITKTKEDITNNIISALNYIEKEIQKGKSCNIMSIIISSLNENWNNSNIIINSENKKGLTGEEIIKNMLSKAINEEHRELIIKLIEEFGMNNYINWLSYLDFRNIKKINESDKLILYSDNFFVIKTIKDAYLNDRLYKNTNDGQWLRKGLKTIIREMFPNIEDVEIVFKENINEQT